VAFRTSGKELVQEQFLQEKARREAAMANRVEAENRRRDGQLVDKAELIGSLLPTISGFRTHLLARSDRLARELEQMQTHKDKTAAIRRADEKALGILADLFDGKSANGNEKV
jgi:maltooligosyltrehalose synthase